MFRRNGKKAMEYKRRGNRIWPSRPKNIIIDLRRDIEEGEENVTPSVPPDDHKRSSGHDNGFDDETPPPKRKKRGNGTNLTSTRASKQGRSKNLPGNSIRGRETKTSKATQSSSRSTKRKAPPRPTQKSKAKLTGESGPKKPRVRPPNIALSPPSASKGTSSSKSKKSKAPMPIPGSPTAKEMEKTVEKAVKLLENFVSFEKLKKKRVLEFQNPDPNFGTLDMHIKLFQISKENEEKKMINIAPFGRPGTGKSYLLNWILLGKVPEGEEYLASNTEGGHATGKTKLIFVYQYEPSLKAAHYRIKWNDSSENILQEKPYPDGLGQGMHEMKADSLQEIRDFLSHLESKIQDFASQPTSSKEDAKGGEANASNGSDSKGSEATKLDVKYSYLDFCRYVEVFLPNKVLNHKNFGVDMKRVRIWDLPGVPESMLNKKKYKQIQRVREEIDVFLILTNRGNPDVEDLRSMHNAGIFDKRFEQLVPRPIVQVVYVLNCRQELRNVEGYADRVKDIQKWKDGKELRKTLMKNMEDAVGVSFNDDLREVKRSSGQDRKKREMKDRGLETNRVHLPTIDEILRKNTHFLIFEPRKAKMSFDIFVDSQTDKRYVVVKKDSAKVSFLEKNGNSWSSHRTKPVSVWNKMKLRNSYNLAYSTQAQLASILQKKLSDLKRFQVENTIYHLDDAMSSAHIGLQKLTASLRNRRGLGAKKSDRIMDRYQQKLKTLLAEAMGTKAGGVMQEEEGVKQLFLKLPLKLLKELQIKIADGSNINDIREVIHGLVLEIANCKFNACEQAIKELKQEKKEDQKVLGDLEKFTKELREKFAGKRMGQRRGGEINNFLDKKYVITKDPQYPPGFKVSENDSRENSVTVINRLGGGLNGIVYLGEFGTNGNLVACKECQLDIPRNSPKYKSQSYARLTATRRNVRVDTEIEILNLHPRCRLPDCSCKYLPTFFGEIAHGKRENLRNRTIVMEYAAAGSLISFVRRCHSEVEDMHCFVIFYQVLKGLAFLHEENYVHRDVKLDNVLLRFDGTVLLADFGVSKKDGGQTKIGSPGHVDDYILGGFAGSESSREENAVFDEFSDIFALGISILHLKLRGKLPLETHDARSFVRSVPKAKRELPFNTDQTLKDFFASCISDRSQKKRPTAKQALLKPFFKKHESKYAELKTSFGKKLKNVLKKEKSCMEAVKEVADTIMNTAKTLMELKNETTLEYKDLESFATGDARSFRKQILRVLLSPHIEYQEQDTESDIDDDTEDVEKYMADIQVQPYWKKDFSKSIAENSHWDLQKQFLTLRTTMNLCLEQLEESVIQIDPIGRSAAQSVEEIPSKTQAYFKTKVGKAKLLELHKSFKNQSDSTTKEWTIAKINRHFYRRDLEIRPHRRDVADPESYPMPRIVSQDTHFRRQPALPSKVYLRHEDIPTEVLDCKFDPKPTYKCKVQNIFEQMKKDKLLGVGTSDPYLLGRRNKHRKKKRKTINELQPEAKASLDKLFYGAKRRTVDELKQGITMKTMQTIRPGQFDAEISLLPEKKILIKVTNNFHKCINEVSKTAVEHSLMHTKTDASPIGLHPIFIDTMNCPAEIQEESLLFKLGNAFEDCDKLRSLVILCGTNKKLTALQKKKRFQDLRYKNRLAFLYVDVGANGVSSGVFKTLILRLGEHLNLPAVFITRESICQVLEYDSRPGVRRHMDHENAMCRALLFMQRALLSHTYPEDQENQDRRRNVLECAKLENGKKISGEIISKLGFIKEMSEDCGDADFEKRTCEIHERVSKMLHNNDEIQKLAMDPMALMNTLRQAISYCENERKGPSLSKKVGQLKALTDLLDQKLKSKKRLGQIAIHCQGSRKRDDFGIKLTEKHLNVRNILADPKPGTHWIMNKPNPKGMFTLFNLTETRGIHPVPEDVLFSNHTENLKVIKALEKGKFSQSDALKPEAIKCARLGGHFNELAFNRFLLLNGLGSAELRW
eukprot:CAMPEP_0184485524 /NCGR_PEP_ID=MMETSP0113_2-20130426/7112_1 /TAXON_ID=91329 /ORGANISM="Norrisiella sphaerica, Strain BC52" /LENGTH=1954 /DNA_ID=CAMNT_0026866993 /DNA_START=39 /DNA_END=5900 /DNA_ORIENTATION=-